LENSFAAYTLAFHLQREILTPFSTS